MNIVIFKMLLNLNIFTTTVLYIKGGTYDKKRPDKLCS